MTLWSLCSYCLTWGFITARLAFLIFFDEEKYLDKAAVFAYLVSVENMPSKARDLFSTDPPFTSVAATNVSSCLLLALRWGIFSFPSSLSTVGLFFLWVDVLAVTSKTNLLLLTAGRSAFTWSIFSFSWVFCKSKNVSKTFKLYEWSASNFSL